MIDPIKAAQLIPTTASMLWVDKGIGTVTNFDALETFSCILKSRCWNGIVFGGFYFKGNNSIVPERKIIQEQVVRATHYMNVLVTSGSCTGIPIELDILKIFTETKQTFALASGVNIDNVDNFLPYVNHFLIGTGIEMSSTDLNEIEFYRSAGLPEAVSVGNLDPSKVKNISNKIKNYKENVFIV